MLSLEEARYKILESVQRLGAEDVLIGNALGRVCARKLIARVDLPLFDNSSVDGYAVSANDVLNATADEPVQLRVIGRVPAGESFSGELKSGESIQVFTGSPLPQGADAVVMVEFTRPVENNENLINILAPVRPWENVRKQGEDIMYGSTIAKAGEKLTIAHLTLLSATGYDRVPVYQMPDVAILSTGTELRAPGEKLERGQIYESNLIMLSQLCRIAGANIKLTAIVPDDEEKLAESLKHAFDESDIVITSGGVSVGKYDYIKSVFEKLGGKLNFWKIIMRPGRPFMFGMFGKKYLFGLPGNPLSAAVTYSLLVRPAIMKMQGYAELDLPVVKGELAETLTNVGNRRHFMRVKLDELGKIHLCGLQESHGLSSLLKSNGLVDVPAHTVIPAGTVVPVIKWELNSIGILD